MKLKIISYIKVNVFCKYSLSTYTFKTIFEKQKRFPVSLVIYVAITYPSEIKILDTTFLYFYLTTVFNTSK